MEAARAWQRRKSEAGYAGISWPTGLGGAGLTPEHERAFNRVEREVVVPHRSEAFNVTLGMVAPTLRACGTDDQQQRFIPAFLRADALCCQLFSEPDAGSDLASLTTSAIRDGHGWRINGQKVWCSGAAFCEWGEAVVRTSREDDRHAGLTVFLVPMHAPGVETRPIVQMTGGASFDQVFLSDVFVDDELRIGPVGGGWKVALATLGFERAGGAKLGGGSYREVVALARRLAVTNDPVVRQELAALYIGHRVQTFFARPPTPGERGLPAAARASAGKLLFTNQLQRVGEVAGQLLGARLTADSGDPASSAWTGHLLGAPGTRIAGGSDEIQRNLIAERGLGLPR
jgi:alkylation response protein AidB-like acyl-CoA dehydrogenase